MSSQIIRVASYTSGSINCIGREEYRERYNHKNTNIDEKRSHLNVTVGNKESTLYQTWKQRKETLNLNFAGKRNQIAMEQILVTASPDFFKKLGWNKEEAKNWERQDIPREIIDYFNDSLRFFKEYIGKENIISATIHFDEETPHLHIDTIPAISGKRKKKDIYLKDANGKCLRNEKGHAIRAKDLNGKTLYDYVDEPASINRSAFWAERGGRQSYRNMQDQFYEKVASKYNLDRGEIGSDRKHEEQAKHKMRELKEKVEEGNGLIHKQAEHIERQRRAIDNNNAIIIEQNKQIDSINEAIEAVNKDEVVMAKLEESLGIKHKTQQIRYDYER